MKMDEIAGQTGWDWPAGGAATARRPVARAGGGYADRQAVARSAGAATGAVPPGQLFVAAKRSARAQDRRLALIGRHGAQAGSQAARTRSRGG